MSTFKAYFRKEFLELLRLNRLLILGVIILFFSLSSPLILYITPKILEQQFVGDFDVSQLITVNQSVAIHGYLGDVYQIFGVVVLFFSLRIFTDEFRSQRVIIPYIGGADLKMMFLAKIMIYSLIITLLLIIGSTLDLAYAGVVFNEFKVSLFHLMISTFKLALFLIFNLSVILLLFSFKLNKFAIMFITLINYYLVPSLINMVNNITISPYKLIAIQIRNLTTESMYSILLTLLLTIMLFGIAIKKLNTSN